MIKDLLASFIEFLRSNSTFTKISRFLLWSLLALCLVVIAVFSIVYFTVPSNNELRSIQSYTSSEVYSSDGKLLGKYYIQDRTNIQYKDIPDHMEQALLATEDARFYKHHGVDTRSVFRVLIKSILLNDDGSGGGSTISQQLAKNLFARKNYWIFSMPINKIREMVIAYKIEGILTKQEILTFYLNTVPFGDNAFGISTASERFFSKKPNKLRPEEAAVLVGMLKGTSLYNPRRNPEKCEERRNVVLEQMVKYEYLSQRKSDSLKALPLKLKYSYKTHNDGLATYFRAQLRKEVSDILKKVNKEEDLSYNLFTDGLKIETTIHSKLQKHAEAAVREHMASLQKDFFAQLKTNKPWQKDYSIIDNAIKRSERYKVMKENGASEEEIMTAFKKPIKMTLFSYNGEITKTLSPIDSIRYSLSFLHAGFLVIEPGTQEVKAWVGGIDHHYFKYDHVNINTKRQVGSTFKPIVYAAALEQGMSPCEYLKNDQLVYKEFENWSPRNADNKYGGEYSLQGALTNSVNTISAQLIMKAGIPTVVNFAHQMGIESPLCMVPSLALGTAEASLMEMVTAYSVFAKGGAYEPATFIKKITDSKGTVIYDAAKQKKNSQRVFSKGTSEKMVHMLQNVVDKGTGSRLRYKYGLTGDIAGKTGTTQNHADGWFIGFTPTLVAGAWVGAEDRRIHFRSIDMGQGASMALPIWGLFMKNVSKDPALKKYIGKNFPLSNIGDMNCDDYIPADTSNKHWWWPFNRSEDDQEDQTFEPMSYNQNLPANTSKEKSQKPLELFKGLFKKKKK